MRGRLTLPVRAGGLLIVLLTLVAAAAFLAPGAAARETCISQAVCLPGVAPSTQSAPAAREQLAAQYAPIVYLKRQEEACDTRGEAFYPAPVEIVLGNPDVALKDADGNVVAEGPTAADLYNKGEGYYLDFPGNPRRPRCTYEEDFKALAPDYPPAVYAHLFNDPGTNQLVLQYWLYFYFNDWNNNHESDWEFIQLAFDATSPEEALTQEPAGVIYAQHGGGERADWNSSKLRKEDGHPVIFTPRGSHGSLYQPKIALGKGEHGTGFGCDDASPPSDRIAPEARLIPNEVSGAGDPFAWITYEGRWGQKLSGEFNGPTGPNMKKQWAEPIMWQQDQRDSSVTVPEDTIGPNVAKVFCGVVATGSKLLFAGGPWLVLGLAIVAIGSIAVTARRTEFRPVIATPLRRRRRFGQIIRAAFRVQREHLGLFLGIGILFVPLGVVLAGLQWLVLEHPPLEPLLEVVDSVSASGVAALAVGGLGIGLAYWLVLSAVIAALGEIDAGRQTGVLAAYRLVRANLGALVGARLRALGFVLLLSITIVGIPLAVRQAVRWTFLEHAIMLDGRSARDARDVSARLVSGHWWRTLGVTVAIAYGAIAAGPIIGIGILLLSSASLSFINLISSIIYVALIPYVAISLTMLYYDLDLASEARAAGVSES